MKKFIFGVLIGISFLVLFIYFGWAKYLKTFGARTEEAGQKLEGYQKPVQETAKTVKKAVDKTYDKTRETVKEYIK